MAAARSRRTQAAKAEYIQGSAARQLTAPERDVRREKKIRERSLSHTVTVRRNRERALQMDLPFVIGLTIAAICALYLCIS